MPEINSFSIAFYGNFLLDMEFFSAFALHSHAFIHIALVIIGTYLNFFASHSLNKWHLRLLRATGRVLRSTMEMPSARRKQNPRTARRALPLERCVPFGGHPGVWLQPSSWLHLVDSEEEEGSHLQEDLAPGGDCICRAPQDEEDDWCEDKRASLMALCC